MKIDHLRGSVDVLDALCAGRPCFRIHENRGTFVRGRGYTKLSDTPELVCGERYLRGCPHPIPEHDPEAWRCCAAPRFPTQRRGATPRRQRCRACGTPALGVVLEIRRSLPALPEEADDA